MKDGTSSEEIRPPPKEWRWVQLGQLADGPESFADGPFAPNWKTGHYSRKRARVVRLQNIGRGTFLDRDKAYVPRAHFQKLQRHSVLPGDVIVAALGDGARPPGRACQVPDGFGSGLVKPDCFRVRPPVSSILREYLVAYLNSTEALPYVGGLMRGATRPRVTLYILRKIPVPLPDLSEQKRLVAALNEKLAAVEKTKAALKEQLEALEALPGAYYRQAFSGDL